MHRPKCFLEFFVAFEAKALTFPREAIKRFEKRIQAQFKISPYALGPDVFTRGYVKSFKDPNIHVDSTLHVYIVDSTGADGPIKRTKEDIEATGAWIVYSDTLPRGGSPAIFTSVAGSSPGPDWPTVAHRSTYFGVDMSPLVYRILSVHLDEIYRFAIREDRSEEKLYTVEDDLNSDYEPRVVYHGTARQNVGPIFKEGLQPSQGMFGRAIYFGSFWKAFRFATLAQDYTRRSGAILRCFAFWSKQPAFRTLASEACLCRDCKILSAAAAAKPNAKSGLERVSDHLGLWTSLSDFVVCYPEYGGPIKNEEYACLNNRTIFIESVGHAEATTEFHEPWNRTLCIL